jgi:hypothetical protein
MSVNVLRKNELGLIFRLCTYEIQRWLAKHLAKQQPQKYNPARADVLNEVFIFFGAVLFKCTEKAVKCWKATCDKIMGQ